MNLAEQAVLRMRAEDIDFDLDAYGTSAAQSVLYDLEHAPKEVINAALPYIQDAVEGMLMLASHEAADVNDKLTDALAGLEREKEKTTALRAMVKQTQSVADKCVREQQDDWWERDEFVELISGIEDRCAGVLAETT